MLLVGLVATQALTAELITQTEKITLLIWATESQVCRIPWDSAGLAIDVSAVSNTDDEHHKAFIFDAAHDTVVTDAVTP
jgi:hypothetical protein